jgi:hypothetical protein
MKLISTIAISESGFIFLPTTGETFTVNEIGSFVLSALQKGRKREEIVSDVLETWDADRPTAERGVDDFILQLRQFRMITDEA